MLFVYRWKGGGGGRNVSGLVGFMVFGVVLFGGGEVGIPSHAMIKHIKV